MEEYDVDIQDVMTVAPRKVDDVANRYFSVYFCKDYGKKGFKQAEKKQILENVKTSPYTKGVGIVTSWPTMGSVSKIFYLHPEMPFLVNGPLVVNNEDFSYDDNFLYKDKIKIGDNPEQDKMRLTPIEMHAGYYGKNNIARSVDIPEMTCPLETDVISHHQRLMMNHGPDGYLNYLKEHPKLSTEVNHNDSWTQIEGTSDEWKKVFKEE